MYNSKYVFVHFLVEENDISCATDDIAVSNGAKKSTLQAVFAIYFPRDEVECYLFIFSCIHFDTFSK